MVAQIEELEFWYNTRSEPREKLAVPFHLRYSQSEPFEREQVVSENISKHGLLIKTNERIPLQTRVYLETVNKRFQALAIVVHSTSRQAGLQILTSKGGWL